MRRPHGASLRVSQLLKIRITPMESVVRGRWPGRWRRQCPVLDGAAMHASPATHNLAVAGIAAALAGKPAPLGYIPGRNSRAEGSLGQVRAAEWRPDICSCPATRVRQRVGSDPGG